MPSRIIGILVLFAALLGFPGTVTLAQNQPATPHRSPSDEAPADVVDLLKQGEALTDQGQPDAALALFQRAVKRAPNVYHAQLLLGMSLDLQGSYAAAQQHLAKAIDLASEEQQVQALRTMAVSYAFQKNTDKAAEYERRAFDLLYNANRYADAAGVADELARIYLECGDLDNAFQWYQTGHLTALRIPDLTAAQKDLWEFRWASAQARIAARRGDRAKAQQDLAAAKAIIDKNDNPDQTAFYPYLAGYVALYTGDYAAAIKQLQLANQKDPFVLYLLAQSYQKLDDKAHALDYYRKILTINTHNPTNAFARPVAKQEVADSQAPPVGR